MCGIVRPYQTQYSIGVRPQACARSTQPVLEVFESIDLRLFIRESNDIPQPPSGVAALDVRRQASQVLLHFARQSKQIHDLRNPSSTQPIAPGNLRPIVNHSSL